MKNVLDLLFIYYESWVPTTHESKERAIRIQSCLSNGGSCDGGCYLDKLI